MPWQRVALDAQLEYDDDGDFRFREALVSTARQQGKSVALTALIGWFLTEYPRIVGRPVNVLSTANVLDRAEHIHLSLAPVLVEYFGAKQMQAIGRKSVTMTDGSKWETRAATMRLHGGSFDLVVADEVFDIPAAVIETAIKPTMIARRSPLFSSWSTAGDQGSDYMIQTRQEGMAQIDKGTPGDLCFLEWSMPDDVDYRDERFWGWANPALGTTVTLKALRAAAGKDYFIRAHLNKWVTARGAWLDPGVWARGKTDQPMPDGGIIMVDCSVNENRYVGVRAAMVEDRCMVHAEFVVNSEAEMWDEVARVMTDPKVQLLISPTLEIHVPRVYDRRYSIAGYAELLRYTSLVQKMVLEGRVLHAGQVQLEEHIQRAVLVKTAQGAVLSSQKSPGPIELARCAVIAISAVSRPTSRQKPTLLVAN